MPRRRLGFGARLKGFWWKPDAAHEVAEELTHHFELLVRDAMDRGLSREAAMAEARTRFGDPGLVRRECEDLAQARDRKVSMREMLADLRDDLRWTLRSLRRSPAYALASGSTLALVVAANALVFTVVYAVLLRPLPYPEPDRLLGLNEGSTEGFVQEISWPNLEDLRAGAKGVASIGAWLDWDVTLVTEDTPRISIAYTTPDFFPVLGRSAMLGRTLEPSDEKALVLSHGAWQTYFGADPAILGRVITLNSDVLTVVGVMPPSFRFPDARIAAWMPLGPVPDWMRNRAVHIFQGIARLEPGVARDQGEVRLVQALAQAQSGHPGEDGPHGLAVRSLRERLTGDARPVLMLLLGSVAAVLLLACANLAGLTATRALQRESELSLRAALGASRGRLVRQLVVESLVLGIAGGVVGLALAAVALPRLLGMLPSDLPSPTAVVLDRTVAIGTLGVALLAGLGIGLVAAFRASRSDPARKMQGSTASTAGRERLLLQRSLVAAQVAISLVILAGAGLLLRSFRAVVGVDPGFRTDGLAVATVALPSSRYKTDAMVAWYAGLPERLGAVPGVLSASAVSSLPITLGDGKGDISIEGRTFAMGEAPGLSYRRALPNYFRTVGIPLIQGREFDARDNGDQMVVIINEALARKFWPGGDAIGKRIKIGPPEREPWLTIVGVVGDVHNEALERAVGFDTYEPHAQRPRGTMSVVVRTSGNPRAVAPLVRGVLQQNDAGLPVWGVGTMEERVRGSLAPRRFTAGVLTAFGASALLLASIGIYGVAAYLVGRRKREFAIRLALGASGTQVRRLVVGESLRVVLIGIVIGLPAGLALTSLIRGLLFNVKPGDPLSHLLAAGLLGALAIAATWLPARRATKADPVSSLRE
ncbi:MAG TPA: ABC transporter permease [Gemmatimonadales bacterium]|nr:ABC transporter permease [Gemmatimonadales bacterium]